MKVLQLCNKAPYPPNDGSSIAISALAEGLIDNGVELHLLTINTKKHYKADDKIPADFKQKSHYQSLYQNTDVTFLGAFTNLFSNQSYFVSRFYFKEYNEALINTLKAHSFDIIQLEGVFMASYIETIKKHSSAKIVLRAHNIEYQIWERHLEQETKWFKKGYLTIQNKRLKAFELQALQAVDAIVTITEEDRKNCLSLVPKANTHTCLTGINLNTYNFVNQAIKPNTVFHFASMDWMPNIEAADWLLHNVWQKVTDVLPNATLVLAGRGMPDRFKKLISKTITVIDSVEHSTEFYNTYDVMLVPLWSGSGLRIKLVEGLAYGKAIITTSIGAEGISYTHNKNLMIADSADEFSVAIISLLQNSEKKKELQQHARILAEQTFDYKSIALQLVVFYKKMLRV